MTEDVEPTVVVEGDLDRAVLIALGFSEKNIFPNKRGAARGRDAAIKLAADRARILPRGPVALVLDRNGFTEEQLRDEVCGELEKHWDKKPRTEGMTFEADGLGTVVLVPAGLPEARLMAELGIERYMMDDYLLCCFLEDEALESYCRGERHVPYRPESAAELSIIHARGTGSFRKRIRAGREGALQCQSKIRSGKAWWPVTAG